MGKINYKGQHPVRCPECEEAFDFEVKLRNVNSDQAIFVDMDCHWCNAPLSVDLKPYLTTLSVLRNGKTTGPTELDLPDELPGKIDKQE